jgi:protein-tyrosine phosphatase
MKILMVCLGNICRSPLAEGLLQAKAKAAGLNWEVDSAGTNGFHNGESPHPLSQKVAAANGIDISNQVSRQLTQTDFEKYDRLYAMANDVLTDMKRMGGKLFDPAKNTLFLNELYPGLEMDVPDPWYGKEEGYVEVFQLIDRTCEALIQNYFATQQQMTSL